MTDVLEQNLRALFARAWQPSEIRPAFRRELRARWLAAVEMKPFVERRRGARALALAATIIGVFLGAFALSLPEALPTDRIATTAEGSELVLAARVGAQASADAAPVRFATLTGDALTLGAGSSVEWTTRAEACELVLAIASTVELEKGSFSPPWKLLTAEGPLILEAGRLRIALATGGLELSLAAGSARVGWDEGGRALPLGRRAVLRGGALEEPPEPLPGPDPLASRTSAAVPEVEPAGPPDDPPSVSRAASLAGRVVDAGGHPVTAFRVWYRPDVELPKVSVPEVVAVEDSGGHFRLTGLSEGRWTLVVESPVHATWVRRGLELAAGEASLEVVLGPAATVEGFVLDAETGAPVAGALVLAEDLSPHRVLAWDGSDVELVPYAHATTDSSGAYSVPSLAEGTRTLRVSHPDYAPRWVDLQASPAATTRAEHVELDTGGMLFGRVERPDGSPWEGCEIIASYFDMRGGTEVLTFGYAVTSHDGAYEIERLAPGDYVVMNLAEQPNTSPEWSRLVQARVEGGGRTRVDFRDEGTAPALEGQIVDVEGVARTDRVLTLLSQGSDAFHGWQATTTRRDGSFTFKDARPGDYRLFASPGTGSAAVMTLLLEEVRIESPSSPLRIEASGATIRGRVRDLGEGTPPHVALILERRGRDGGWFFAGKCVSADGSFRFEDPPPGTYRAWAIAPGRAAMLSRTIDVAPGEASTVELELPPGSALALRVVDERGRPVPDAWVELSDAEGRVLPYAADRGTDADGRLAVGSLPAGPMRVEVTVQGEERVHADVVLLEGERLERTVVVPIR